MRPAQGAFPRFLVVGGATALASAIAIAGLVEGALLDPIVAAAVVALAANLAGFVLNRRWSFLAAHEHPLPQLLRYFCVSVAAFVTSVALFALLTKGAGMHYVIASLVVSAVFAATNFLAHLHWSFAEREPRQRSA
jgi:putative flippase GtrA